MFCINFFSISLHYTLNTLNTTVSRRRQDGEKVFANVEVQKLQEGGGGKKNHIYSKSVTFNGAWSRF